MDETAQEIIGVTQKFCARMAAAQFSDLPKKAIDEGKRGVRANRRLSTQVRSNHFTF